MADLADRWDSLIGGWSFWTVGLFTHGADDQAQDIVAGRKTYAQTVQGLTQNQIEALQISLYAYSPEGLNGDHGRYGRATLAQFEEFKRTEIFQSLINDRPVSVAPGAPTPTPAPAPAPGPGSEGTNPGTLLTAMQREGITTAHVQAMSQTARSIITAADPRAAYQQAMQNFSETVAEDQQAAKAATLNAAIFLMHARGLGGDAGRLNTASLQDLVTFFNTPEFTAISGRQPTAAGGVGAPEEVTVSDADINAVLDRCATQVTAFLRDHQQSHLTESASLLSSAVGRPVTTQQLADILTNSRATGFLAGMHHNGVRNGLFPAPASGQPDTRPSQEVQDRIFRQISSNATFANGSALRGLLSEFDPDLARIRTALVQTTQTQREARRTTGQTDTVSVAEASALSAEAAARAAPPPAASTSTGNPLMDGIVNRLGGMDRIIDMLFGWLTPILSSMGINLGGGARADAGGGAESPATRAAGGGSIAPDGSRLAAASDGLNRDYAAAAPPQVAPAPGAAPVPTANS
jgi:hypothetical protein